MLYMRRLPGILTMVIILVCAVLFIFKPGPVATLVRQYQDHTPGELIRYVQRRLEGHTKLETVFNGPLLALQARYERPVSLLLPPNLGKGQQPKSFPVDEVPGAMSVTIMVSTPAALADAIDRAVAGQTIDLAPGHYPITRTLTTRAAGTAAMPIRVRTMQPGQAIVEFATVEGFKVRQPYWVFENLQIKGVCKTDDQCEHAFHVTGDGHHVVIRNNAIQNFNAPIKVNGEKGHWPDDGQLSFNTLTNAEARHTGAPVTLVDIVGVNSWVVSDNLISNFVKEQGNQISYGVFMKGGGKEGRIERNLVICTPQNVSRPGARVAISMGGGTTGAAYCRDKRCVSEHTAGIVANNIVAHCNDFGVDINRSDNIVVAHNTLINTSGITLRGSSSGARLYANLFDGTVIARGDSQAESEFNDIGRTTERFKNADELDLAWQNPPTLVPRLSSVPTDFYGKPRADDTAPGALQIQ